MDEDPDERQYELLAANTLMKHPEAPALFKMLMDVVALPDRLKVVLTDDAAVLNPLLATARRDRSRFDAIIGIVEARRAALGRPPLRQEDPERFEKNKYQRELMASIRVRTFKAAATENLRRPPRDQLIGVSRLEFMRVQRSKWTARLNALLATARAANGGTLPKAERQAIADTFWGKIDAEMDAEEAAVYRWIQSGRVGPAP